MIVRFSFSCGKRWLVKFCLKFEIVSCLVVGVGWFWG